MALTKAQIVDSISEDVPMYRHQATQTAEILLEIIKSTLESGDDILISRFGKFWVKDKQERKGRNPTTGGPQMLRKRRVVRFRCSGILRARINARKGKKSR